jgi:predicted metal-dependent hydrolase
VSIAVEPTGEVVVTAPTNTTIARLEGLVRKKATWILERRRQRDELAPLPTAREFVSGESFRYLGRQYRLKVEPVGVADPDDPVRLLGGYLRVEVPRRLPIPDLRVREALVAWYRAKAAAYLPGKLATWAARVGVPVPRLLVTEPPKRWGSASKTGVVRINWRAIQAPPALVEYVVAHELVHLRHDDHSRAFWTALGRILPDYESRKDRLRALGPSLVW